jgi:hypothetical protein
MEEIKPSSYGQRRNFSSIDILAEKWLMAYDQASITKQENPPSIADVITHELEKVLFFTQLISFTCQQVFFINTKKYKTIVY